MTVKNFGCFSVFECPTYNISMSRFLCVCVSQPYPIGMRHKLFSVFENVICHCNYQ